MKNYIIIIISIFFFSACISEKKQRMNAQEFYKNHPEELAQNCAEKFPLITEYVKGESIYKVDTVFQKGIVIPCPPVYDTLTKNTRIPVVKCPDTKIVYQRILRVDTIKKEDSRKVYLLNSQIEQIKNKNGVLQSDLENLKESGKKKLWLLIISVLLNIGCLFLMLKR